MNEGSAYDLFLSRTLQRASLVRGEDGIGLLREQGLEAAAGIRQVVADFAARTAGFRMIGEGFMQVRQALGHHAGPRPGHRPFPGRVRRGTEGQRLHRRRTAALGSGQRPRSVTDPRFLMTDR